MTATVRFLAATGDAPLAEVRVPKGAWLTAAATRAAVGIVHDCDGQGVCGTCRVRIETGAERLSGPDAEERAQLGSDIGQGWRLCCRLRVPGNLTVRLPEPGFAYPPRLQR